MEGSTTSCPVSYFPLEITSKIFVHCLPDSGLYHTRTEAPMVLTQICRQWRAFTLSTPILWSSIYIISDEWKKPVQLLKMWLSRSGTHPLTLELTSFRSSHSKALIEASIVYANQWRKVKLFLPKSSLSAVNITRGVFPILESLHVQKPWDLKYPKTTEEIVIQDAPLLREVQLHGFPHLKVTAPWGQLTRFVIDASDPLVAMSVIQRCTALTHLEYGEDSLQTGSHRPQAPIELPLLQSLSTTDPSVLLHLTLPGLRKLQLKRPNFDNALEPLQSLLGRSGCDLQSLDAQCPLRAGTPNQISNRLNQLFGIGSSLVHLKLDSPLVQTLQQAITTLGMTDVLPRLQQLYLVQSSPGEGLAIYYGALLVMLHYRGMGGVPERATLQSFQLSVTSVEFIPDLVLPQFRELALHTGLKIRMDAAPVVVLDV
ncbi:hypothetical protein C8J57DRAFT_318752 [Mycena rebaudengoi]|nr:hypothetical protein C8J57DRAFT_318752 [Mycena rebaudengoi]